MQPYFTVIIALYQCEPFVEECLNSLIGQSFSDFEAICVDDGSTDGSLAKARSVAGEDERFRFFALPENRGQSAARNKALDEATGNVVVLLDADDYLRRNALERIHARMEEQRLDDLYFNASSFYEDAAAYECVVEDFSGRESFNDVAAGTALFAFFEQRDQFFPHGALRAVRKSLIEAGKIRFKEGIIHEDLLFTFQALVASKRSSFLNEELYCRRIRKGSTMGAVKRSMRNIEGHLASIRFMRSWMDENAATLDPSFVAAMSHRLNAYLNVCALDYLNDVSDDEKARHLAALDPVERVAFEMDVAQRAEMLRELYASRTWRAGLAVTAAPRAVRDALAKLSRPRG